ncbi:hormogonium polysaccharide secretion pseudopilin HpsC, partial [aff. Roholtiella sp. LEGE 12411]|uniref:hormogonium polysaccharide secretion pseudopilin HpsC n=1 Tax=aff. Roholtiella sp. LEGE 12411 TaxID=1828822 RepID=UPI00187E6530|nr:prepilin-type N-terminal cleavage/methylation domain-containing protein [aff. Roholtiella sp. LEGE 12411]
MMKTLKFLLRSQLTRSRVVQQVGGFTLIELLVAMIMAFLVITPLMGFMINIMNTDRQEQAKANSEQEIQAALDYIARDLQQAIYIYDATGIDTLSQTTNNGPQIPNGTDRVPVLVFWKRELVSQAITVDADPEDNKDDTFVYSLVAYYLIKDSNDTWSKAARIARWQIRDGVADPSSTQTCGKYLAGKCPDPGFAPFKLDGIGTLAEKMNAWTKAAVVSPAVLPAPIVLVDFIDQTRNDDVPPAPVVICPSNPLPPD